MQHSERNQNDSDQRLPVIGISGADDSPASVAAMVTQIRATGADVRIITHHDDRIAKAGSAEEAAIKDLAGLDALVVMGNKYDIDPARYGAAKHEKTEIEANKGRADYEFAALKQALDMGMPVLGVCGGMQRMNVLKHDKNGGTLLQNVPDVVGSDLHNQCHDEAKAIPLFVPVQLVHVEKGTQLAEIAGQHSRFYTPAHEQLPEGYVMENSAHHQAVDKVRRDFVVCARSQDGIAEAIEPAKDSVYGKREQFVLGVQWHPEFSASELGAKIANRLAEAAQGYSLKKGEQVDLAAEEIRTPGASGMLEQVLKRRQETVLMQR